MIPAGLGISAHGPQIVTNAQAFGWQYTVTPFWGWPVSKTMMAGAVEPELMRGRAPTVLLPRTPYSYPSVGASPILSPRAG